MYKYRRIIVSVIVGLIILAMLAGLVISAFAESSSSIKNKITDLKEEAQKVSEKQRELNQEIKENGSDVMDLVEQKGQIDQQIKLTQDEIEIKNEMIREYNLLIAEKQNELDDATDKRAALNQKYKARIRSMEESSALTYWSILFKASSFADLLDRIEMINEIAAADSRMLDQLEQAAKEIETARAELSAEKDELEEAKAELAETEQTLDEQRAEADEIFAKLIADREALQAAAEKYDSLQIQLANEIAAKEVEYQNALQEEERARLAAEAAARARANANSGSSSSGSSSSGSSGRSGGGSGLFIWPCSARKITCGYGPRIHPTTGNYSSHTGIDIGAYSGDPIYAAASGTVTTATYGTAYGNYVTINHGNGYSTLYGHMTRYIVSAGDHVDQGQVIGYVGNTGWSTGPHLHFTVYKNGSLVNPLNYLP